MPHSLANASPAFFARRTVRVAALVLAAHGLLIWALVQGLLQRPVEVLVPAVMLAQLVEPSAPRPTPPTPRPAEPPKAAPPPPKAAPPSPPPPRPAPPIAPSAQPSPLPAVPPSAPSAPSPNAATAPPSPPAAASPTPPAPASPSPAPTVAAPPPAPAPVQLPSTQADYLQNPKPAYPQLSLRLGESGRSVHRVWIGPDGRPQRAELVRSSGFARLDKAAYDAVMAWRYVPGKRGGVPELMAFDVPISWELPN